MKTQPIFWYRWKTSEVDFNALLAELNAEFVLGRTDVGMVGLIGGELTPAETAPASMALVLAAGSLVDRTGGRGYGAAPVTLPFTLDHEGALISMPPVDQLKWLLVQGRRVVTESVPVLDGRDHEVNSRSADLRRIEIVQGAAGLDPAKPAPVGDGVILFDVLVSHGTAAITLDLVDYTRQEVIPQLTDLPAMLAQALGNGVVEGGVAAGEQVIPLLPEQVQFYGTSAKVRLPDGGWSVLDKRVTLGESWEFTTEGLCLVTRAGSMTVRFFGTGLAMISLDLFDAPSSLFVTVDDAPEAEVAILPPGMGGAMRYTRTVLASGLACADHVITVRMAEPASYNALIPFGFVFSGPSATAEAGAGVVLLDGKGRAHAAASLTPSATEVGRRAIVVYDPASRLPELIEGEEVTPGFIPALTDHEGEELYRELNISTFKYTNKFRGGDAFDPAIHGWSMTDIGTDPETEWDEDGDGNVLSKDNSALFCLAFEGTGLDLQLMVGPDMGELRVMIYGLDEDGIEEKQLEATIDCYLPVYSTEKVFKLARGLRWGQHVLYAWPSGTKNIASTDTMIGFVKERTFRIWRPATPATPDGKCFLAALSVFGLHMGGAPSYRRLSSAGGGFAFEGTWALHDMGQAPFYNPFLAETYAPMSTEAGAKVKFKFWGTGIFVGMGTVGGNAAAHWHIDGGAEIANNAGLNGLADGLHTVEIHVLGALEAAFSHVLIIRSIDVDPLYQSMLTPSERFPKRFPLT